jgi:hypothetical protein
MPVREKDSKLGLFDIQPRNMVALRVIYMIAFPFKMERAMRSRHALIWSWLNISGQSFDRKSMNMHVKTPQSYPIVAKQQDKKDEKGEECA